MKKRIICIILASLLIVSLLPYAVMASGSGNLEFTIAQGDQIGADGKSIEYANGYKLSVTYTDIGDNRISLDNGHTELRNIPDGTEVTFTLTVPDGQTQVPDLMLSGARETFTDNIFKTNLNFSQNSVVIVSLDFGTPGPGPNPGQDDGHIVKIQIRNNDGANGSVLCKFGAQEFTTYTVANYDDSGNIKVDIPDGATSVTFKAVPDGSFSLQDCTILHDDQDIDNTKAYMNAVKGDGYEYTLPDDDKTIVFRADFGNKLKEWNAVSWGGGNVHIENGRVEAYAVTVGENTYDESVEAPDEDNHLYPLSDITGVDIQTHDVAFGDTDLFIAEDCDKAVAIDFRFIPDYGYQVSDVRATEDSLLSQFTPGEEISTFHFDYQPKTDVHFIVEFSSSEDIINSKSDIVESASIAGGEKAISSGNLKMNIEDVGEDQVSDALKDAVGGNVAQYLDMELYQVVSMGGERDNWEDQLFELDGDIDVSLTVPTLDPGGKYYVVREHNDAEEEIPAEYDPETSTLTFPTDKFSTYALVMDVLEDGEFTVEYDDWFNEEKGEPEATVDVNEEFMYNGEYRDFEANEPMTFTLNPPESRSGSDAIVEIQVLDGNEGEGIYDTVYRSDFPEGDENRIVIEDNEFTFTPEKESPFIVRIWWSEFDFFGPEEGEYMTEVNVNGPGSVSVSPESERSVAYNDDNPVKRCYEVGQSVTFTFTPDENAELTLLVIGEDIYSNEPDEFSKPLSELNPENGVYTVTVKGEEEGAYFYIEAVFANLPEEEKEPEEPKEPEKPVIPETGDMGALLYGITALNMCGAAGLCIIKKKKNK